MLTDQKSFLALDVDCEQALVVSSSEARWMLSGTGACHMCVCVCVCVCVCEPREVAIARDLVARSANIKWQSSTSHQSIKRWLSSFFVCHHNEQPRALFSELVSFCSFVLAQSNVGYSVGCACG
jgi:hypothetical protein